MLKYELSEGEKLPESPSEYFHQLEKSASVSDYEFQKGSGDVSKYADQVILRAKKEQLGNFEANEKYRTDIWWDLKEWEKKLDLYKLLCEKYSIEDRKHFFPDTMGHVNVFARLIRDVPGERKNYAPEVTELAIELDKISFEKMQLLRFEHPEIVKEAVPDEQKRQSNFIAWSSIDKSYYNAADVEIFNRVDFVSACEQEGILEKYFDKLGISKQREDRLCLSQELLKILFETERTRIEQPHL
ncbi:MAG: hypothetical protein WC621_02490 [Patescibacteria group bacterium]